ncbi:MAG: CAP domain-containing protein [Proteobacteria bacterium]|nr:CAP domain-containing protein [Pseudomonadota bacterium]
MRPYPAIFCAVLATAALWALACQEGGSSTDNQNNPNNADDTSKDTTPVDSHTPNPGDTDSTSDNGDNTPEPVDTTPPTDSEEISEYCQNVADWPQALQEKEAALIAILNQHRAEGFTCSVNFGGDGAAVGGDSGEIKTAPLKVDAALQCVARNHAQDMAINEFFDYDSSDGKGLMERLKLAGGSHWFLSSYIMRGLTDPSQTAADLLEDPDACDTLLSSNWVDIGVGFYAGGPYQGHWSIVIAFR